MAVKCWANASRPAALGEYLPGGVGPELRDAYPRMADFLAIARRFDPRGRFMNALVRATFLGIAR